MAARKADDLPQTLLEGNAGWKRNAETPNEQLGEDRNALSSDAEATELLDVLAGISLGLSRTVSAPSTSRLPLSSPMSSMSGSPAYSKALRPRPDHRKDGAATGPCP
ncbi:hypothetical protein A4X13_0g6478, partial [Tilletia indica]